MTATDELRRMLDERGVEYETRDGDTVKNTYWSCNGLRWGYTEDVDYSGMIDPMMFPMVGGQLTFAPEQAIDATLGAGTCRLPETRIDHGSIEYNGTTSWRLCSACGAEVLADPANYCPNCGRKVEG